MKRIILPLLLAVLPLLADISVVVEPMTFTLESARMGGRGSTPENVRPGAYPIKGTEETTRDTVDVIKINNGLIEAWICPAYAGRLLRVVDLKTGLDYFKWMEVFQDKLAWQTGGVKPSFPFFEHGTHLRQPAGYRVVRNPDGSVTVAMDQRFTHHAEPRDRERYGRYSDEALNILITVRPGDTAVEWRQRKENLNPTPRSEKNWNVVLFPQEKLLKPGTKMEKVRDPETGKMKRVEVEALVPDHEAMQAATDFIYPAPWVVDHGPTRVHTAPHWSQWGEDGPQANANWNVSHFALFTPYGFGGAWYPKRGVNRLRIHNPGRDQGPALKLYSAYWPEFVELWGGQGVVFEVPDPVRPGYVPVDVTHWFWITHAIGKADIANRHVAVSVDGDRFRLTASRAGRAVVTDATGAKVAEGPVDPYSALEGAFEGKLSVTLDGETVLDQTLPLDMPTPSKDKEFVAGGDPSQVDIPQAVLQDFQWLLDQRNPEKNPTYWEEENFMHNEGMTRQKDVRQFKGRTDPNPERALSKARVFYRLGDLDEALRIAEEVGTPEADFLKGLIQFERTGSADFGKAGPGAGYHRALLAIQKDDKPQAVRQVDLLLAAHPDAWIPRLARAYWADDPAVAHVLAAENPGSPEAQLVLKLLAEPHDLDSLLENNPSAKEHLQIFEGSLTRGTWTHLPRFPQENL